MNLNFCVRWPQPIASGANSGGHWESGNRKARSRSADDLSSGQSTIGHRQSAILMSRTNIIALLIFGAILGYFLSFGPETTQKFKTGVYRLLAPFLTGGSGIKKQITSV